MTDCINNKEMNKLQGDFEDFQNIVQNMVLEPFLLILVFAQQQKPDFYIRIKVTEFNRRNILNLFFY